MLRICVKHLMWHDVKSWVGSKQASWVGCVSLVLAISQPGKVKSLKLWASLLNTSRINPPFPNAWRPRSCSIRRIHPLEIWQPQQHTSHSVTRDNVTDFPYMLQLIVFSIKSPQKYISSPWVVQPLLLPLPNCNSQLTSFEVYLLLLVPMSPWIPCPLSPFPTVPM